MAWEDWADDYARDSKWWPVWLFLSMIVVVVCGVWRALNVLWREGNEVE